MAYLEFEAIGVPRVKTERSVAYIDHNTLQNGFENADDHRFIGSVVKKHGIYFSRPGNGICHNMISLPIAENDMNNIEILRGPNIKSYPVTTPLLHDISCVVSLKVGDNITTDHIMPAGAKILPLRSNIPAISKHCFTVCDDSFPARAMELGESIIVGGSNYGQGSSREHAALAPLYLGIKAVVVKSFARIHRANLINAGILPLTFANESDYDKIAQGDEIALENVRADIEAGRTELTLMNRTTGEYNVP